MRTFISGFLSLIETIFRYFVLEKTITYVGTGKSTGVLFNSDSIHDPFFAPQVLMDAAPEAPKNLLGDPGVHQYY